MNVTQAIFRRSVFFLALIPLFAAWGFWTTYIVRPAAELSPYDHAHGAAMLAWCLMLILQSALIRANRRDIHRRTGKISFLLVPVIVVSTVLLAHYRLNQRGLTEEGLYILSLQVFLLAQFTVLYVLAILNRKRPDVHARWMVCTALPLLDPIFARIIGIYFIQVEITTGIHQYITYGFTNLIVITLLVADWRSQGRRDVFLPALFILLATQLPSFFVLGWPAWEAFAAWFLQTSLT